MLEIQNPSPAPLVRSLLLRAERVVPVIIPARCKPRKSLRILWRSRAIALPMTAVMVSTPEVVGMVLASLLGGVFATP